MLPTKKFLQDEIGASLGEYSLLVSLIAVVCIGAITAVGVSVNVLFTLANSI
jgi:pilus assembly protein Flp/PilA